MNTTQLNQKLARLEFVHDQLESELSDLDTLLKSIGFPEGLSSAKEVAVEMLENEETNENGTGEQNFGSEAPNPGTEYLKELDEGRDPLDDE